MRILFLFMLAIFAAQPACAYEKLIAQHSKAAKIPSNIAIAIAKQESGLNPHCVNVEGDDYAPANRAEAEAIIKKAEAENKSYDVGLMQINSQWIHKWKIDPCSLLDPEANVRAGIRIFKEEIQRHGLNWKAVGAYHSPDPTRAMLYASQVFGRMHGKGDLGGIIANPRLQVLVDKGILTRAEARSILSNPRLNRDWRRGRMKLQKMGLLTKNGNPQKRSAVAEYARIRAARGKIALD